MCANQASFPIAVMARVLGVSEAGYYAWRQRPPSAHAVADAALRKRVRTIHASSRETYGAPRVHAELRAGGEKHGRKRVARLMRAAGLVGASRRRNGVTTTRRDPDARPAPDLVDRDFTATAPNQLWVADITFVPTANGFLYLAVVLDAWSRKIVGWAELPKVPPAKRVEWQRRGWPPICAPSWWWTRWRWPLVNAAPAT
jgi:putative transposase